MFGMFKGNNDLLSGFEEAIARMVAVRKRTFEVANDFEESMMNYSNFLNDVTLIKDHMKDLQKNLKDLETAIESEGDEISRDKKKVYQKAKAQLYIFNNEFKAIQENTQRNIGKMKSSFEEQMIKIEQKTKEFVND